MEVSEYLKLRGRMTRDCCIMCDECPLDKKNNGLGIPCVEVESKCPDRAVVIVSEWAEKHPVKTRLSELLKLFPDLPVCEGGYIDICPKNMVKGFECPESITCWGCEKAYWLEEII